MGSEYWHEDSLRLEKQLEDLKHQRKMAEEEAQHARSLHLDMDGPIKAAEAEVQRLSEKISHAERLVERVKAGFYYLERRGFKDAIDAMDEVSAWEDLSEVPVPGLIWGKDQAIVRLPLEVQQLYAQAVSTRLFEAFELCMCYELPDDLKGRVPERPVRSYLFGSIQSPNIEDEARAIFLIAQW